MKSKRARSSEQKQERVNQILTTARHLLDQKRYENITILSIAEQANFTRSNIYKYFQTKEEIYLEILKIYLVEYIEELIPAIALTHTQNFSSVWTEHLNKYPQMLFLLSILFTVLEHNIRVENLADFKGILMEKTQDLLATLLKTYPQKNSEEWLGFFQIQMALIIGLYPMSQQTPKQKEAHKLNQQDPTPPNFTEIFTKAISTFINF